ncbi:MAG: pentapeptide repeat-containing protein [Planctomycetes bacterium]|nr:pentapeptide repeat-containing protein [Planctomycetota bacterium]
MKTAKAAQRWGLALGLALLFWQGAAATIYNWQTGQPIPGTEGITPQPGVDLSDWNTASHNLQYGDFRTTDLNHSHFEDSWLDYAHFGGANLTSADIHYATLSGANLSGANLTSAFLRYATLTSANLTDAVVQGAYFGYTTSRGFTKEQLYSTASWKAKDLTGIGLAGNDLSGWNLTGQNLTEAKIGSATLTGADLTDALVQKADFGDTTSRGFTKEQLYSTASWKAKDLTGIRLGGNNLPELNLAGQNLTSAYFSGATLSGADLSGANLTSAFLKGATLTGADLADAVVQGADFGSTTSRGFTKEQLYSTAGWKAKDLRRIGLAGNDLSGWNLAGQNLTSAHLSATLTGAELTDAVVQGADFGSTTSRGFTKEQLYSTASWKAKDLTGIGLAGNDLSGWNLAGQNLTTAFLNNCTLTGANLMDANLTSANFSGADLALADLRKATGADLPGAITRNTILPDGTVAGLKLLAGDTLVIRNCDLAVTVQGTMTLDGASVLKFLLEGGWGSTVAAPAGAVPDLGGTLYLGFAEGLDPATLVGQTLDIFNWNDPLDAGNRFDDVRCEPWASWDLGALYTTGEVTLLAVPEPATLSLLALGMLCIASARRRCRPLA